MGLSVNCFFLKVFRIGACYAAMMVTVIKAMGKLDAFHAKGHVSGRHSMKEKRNMQKYHKKMP